MSVSIEYYLGLSAVLFGLGALGVLVRRNIIVVLMCIELMLNAVNLTFVALGRSLQLLDGQVIPVFVMAVAAAEAAVALALVVCLFRLKGTLDADEVSGMRG
ncbi:MAG: NADH-quinone oxidoreductase subunit NuoK [Planctomycetes bacterium]|nr:NADH-quinone oxidoreductase subunit NuoK [Planctomycetota bacterium]